MDDTQVLLTNILSLGEWATWKNCIDQVNEELQSWKIRVNGIHFRRVYLVGCGSSFYASQVGKFILEHIVHLPAEARQAFSFTNYTDPSLFSEDTLVIGLSTTGETSATCSALSFARENGATTLAITAVPDSKITEIAQDTIYTSGRVNVIVKTCEYVQSLISIYLLAINLPGRDILLKDELKTYWQDQIRLAYEITHQFLDMQQARITEMVDEYQYADNFFILGCGPNAGTAEEAALKVIEMAKIYSDGLEMEDFFHGRDREINARSPVFFLATQNAGLERMLDFLAYNRRFGVPSILLGTESRAEFQKLTTHHLFLEGPLDEFATPLVYITPLYLFSYYLALMRGFPPNARRFSMGALSMKYRGSEFDGDNVR
jgi:glucosamine--fructose-6-phosphate aminotransferase (isomerizing)